MNTSRSLLRGASLPELLVVISVLSVLAGISIPKLSGILGVSKDQVAIDMAEAANRAVDHYDQTGQDMPIAEDDSGTVDEIKAWYTLTTRDSSIPGSPFLPETFPSTTSASTDTYRLQWTGKNFRVLTPGVVGSGIQVESD
jgi:prepilin-type N-terminal cleavage/methylation domain-containing protein